MARKVALVVILYITYEDSKEINFCSEFFIFMYGTKCVVVVFFGGGGGGGGVDKRHAYGPSLSIMLNIE